MRLRSQRFRRKGASAILNIFLFGVMVVFALMNINLSNYQRHRVASQVACDLSSRYATDALARGEDQDSIKSIAEQMIKSHTNMGSHSDSFEIEVEYGSAVNVNGRLEFKLNATPLNSVRVSTSYDIPAYGVGSGSSFNVVNTATNTILERDVCLVIDRSGSMNFDLNSANWIYDGSWGIFHPMNYLATSRYYWHRYDARYWWHYRPHPTRSRWSSMMPAVYGLADELNNTMQQENFSIVSFSTPGSVNWYSNDRRYRVQRYSRNAADLEVDLTKNYQWAASRFDQIYTQNKLVSGGTNISAGIDLAADVLTRNSRNYAFKTMIVMTDGQYNSGRSPHLAAEDAARKGIEVYTVTFSRQADQYAMRRAAQYGNGKHFHALDGSSLEDVFRQIANIPPNVRIE